MGFFSNPKCPYCGNELTETGYCAPYPAWRCVSCIKHNQAKKEIASLKQRIERLEMGI